MLCSGHFEKGCLEMFPFLCDFDAENDVSPIKTIISVHLKNLEMEFSNLFKNLPNGEFQQFLNPFVKNIKIHHLDIKEDRILLSKFRPLHNWWVGLKN